MVVVRGLDVHGKPQRLRAYDYLARIFQHEIDHLEGVLFIDRVSDPSKIHRIGDEAGGPEAGGPEAGDQEAGDGKERSAEHAEATALLSREKLSMG